MKIILLTVDCFCVWRTSCCYVFGSVHGLFFSAIRINTIRMQIYRYKSSWCLFSYTLVVRRLLEKCRTSELTKVQIFKTKSGRCTGLCRKKQFIRTATSCNSFSFDVNHEFWFGMNDTWSSNYVFFWFEITFLWNERSQTRSCLLDFVACVWSWFLCWWRGLVINTWYFVSNTRIVAILRARLLLRWVTVGRWVNHLGV